MSIMEIKWGLVPDMSITQTLRDLMPMDVAKELTFTGRISTALPRMWALVTRVADDPFAAAMELAEEIAGNRMQSERVRRYTNKRGTPTREQGWSQGPGVNRLK